MRSFSSFSQIGTSLSDQKNQYPTIPLSNNIETLTASVSTEDPNFKQTQSPPL